MPQIEQTCNAMGKVGGSGDVVKRPSWGSPESSRFLDLESRLVFPGGGLGSPAFGQVQDSVAAVTEPSLTSYPCCYAHIWGNPANIWHF